MTEVRHDSKNNNSGLFASRAYKAGDVILKEDVLFTFGPTSPEQNTLLQSQLVGDSRKNKKNKKGKKNKNKSSSMMDDINVPDTVDANYVGKFRGMLLAAISFVLFANNNDNNNNDNNNDVGMIRERLLSLYAPSLTTTTTTASSSCSEFEKGIVDVAVQVKEYCKTNACAGSQLQAYFQAADNGAVQQQQQQQQQQQREQDLVRAMLIWTCNAFHGGSLYEQTSRINHSCDPNAIIYDDTTTNTTTNNNEQQLQQPQPQVVLAAGDIYIGDEICISYLGTFTYAGGAVRLARLKHTKHFLCHCPRCQSCDYASAIPCPSCHPRTIHNKYLEEDIQYDDDQSVHYAHPKNASTATTSARCQHCNDATTTTTGGGIMTIANKVAEKVATHMLSQQLLATTNNSSSSSSNIEQNDVQSEMDEQLFQLSSSVLGSRHWCTNFMMLVLLNRQLKAMNSAMILTGAPPDLTDVAECIDSLERLWTYMAGLHMRMSPSHLLAGPTIGIARVLISLGDDKSQTYGAEWVRRVEPYIQQGFEGPSMIKVVNAIKDAAKNNNTNNTNNNNSSSFTTTATTNNKNNEDNDAMEEEEEEDDGFFEENGNKKKRVKN